MQAVFHLKGIMLKFPELLYDLLLDKFLVSFPRLKVTFNLILKRFFIFLLGFQETLKTSFTIKTDIAKQWRCSSKDKKT